METNNIIEVTTNYPDAKRKALHERLVLGGRVLKCTVAEAIELISGLEQLKNLECQTGNLFLEDMNKVLPLIEDKIVVKYINLESEDHSVQLIYWSPCSIIDFLAVSGVIYHQTGTTVFEGAETEVKVSFLAKDIKKSFDNIELKGDVDDENVEVLQRVLQNMVDEYFRSKYAVKDSIYYFLSLVVDSETNEFSIRMIRDTKNSPKPQKFKKHTDDVKKTIISLEK